jgi:hypothetical protein
MSNRLALILGFVLLAGIGLDLALNAGAAMTFLLKKLFDAVEFLIFWR